MSSGRKSRGRQKIEMKKMSNESNLQVTFSKRRSGLFKKASELCTLCGADVALVVFSPGEKVFSFGQPNVDTVIDRYLSRVPPQNNGTMQFIEAHRSANLRELNTQLTQINQLLDMEKKRAEGLSNLRKATESQFWWAGPVDGMNRAQLEFFKKALEETKKLVGHHADRLVIESAPTQTIQFFGGNSSSSNMPLHHQPNPPQTQMFPTQYFQNPMLQPQLFGFNNMGGRGGYGPSGFF
ncbi:putative transcription factor MADS-type1 family [Medicago truncatula]|uniref:MADS-box transcription factor family protein n=1 Tax=Medicago truncatula TaxID=3880 RepID=A0A072VPP2_MEDTR|nr:agamous-like MADS-box protein AGL62 [Medicago truncatula]KEH43979.1 MADS-box transcription factor family protein [Medicago truncatula]RHN82146.1 putative transcription factor MADS-type1 family [Medicago truncatula]